MSPRLYSTPHSYKPGVNSHHILQAYTPTSACRSVFSSYVWRCKKAEFNTRKEKKKSSVKRMLLLYVSGWSSTQGAPGLCVLAATWLKLTGCSTERWRSKHSSFPRPAFTSRAERGEGRSGNWNNAAAHQGSCERGTVETKHPGRLTVIYPLEFKD